MTDAEFNRTPITTGEKPPRPPTRYPLETMWAISRDAQDFAGCFIRVVNPQTFCFEVPFVDMKNKITASKGVRRVKVEVTPLEGEPYWEFITTAFIARWGKVLL